MSNSTTTSVVKDTLSAPITGSAPVLITERQVLLSTAAAVPLRKHRVVAVPHPLRTATSWWRTRAERKPIRHDYPARLTFLEASSMSREMDRL